MPLLAGWMTLSLAAATAAGYCLNGAVPAEERRNITIDGNTMPLGIFRLAFGATPQLSAAVYKILAEEVLGFNTVYSASASTTAMSVFALAGCRAFQSYSTDPQCPTNRSTASFPHHVTFEAWETYYMPSWPTLAAGIATPVMAGSLGYSGRETFYVPDAPRLAAIRDTGCALAHYEAYNASACAVWDYFDNYTSIDTTRLLACGDTKLTNVGLMANYFAMSGDADGVVRDSNGVVTAGRCWDGAWWLSPACRHVPHRCIPVISGGDGWGFDNLMQKAAAFGMPVAIAAGAGYGEYLALPVQYRTIFYWWEPDTAFYSLGATDVLFPRHDWQAYAQGDYRTAALDINLHKLYFADLDLVAPVAAHLTRQLGISEGGMITMITDIMTTGDSHEDVACRWLRSNQAIWSLWIPDARECSAGEGMVDSANNFTSEWDNAVSCVLCPTGRLSTLIDSAVSDRDVRTCFDCPSGKFSNALRATACGDCSPGYFAATPGQSGCSACTLGTFQSNSGSSGCGSCGDGRLSPAAWTTMQEIPTEAGSVVAYVNAASASSTCTCDAGYRFEGAECVACSAQLDCEGMGRHQVLSGYAALNGDVRRIFECSLDSRWCPGGDPGVCAAGREGIQCGQCKPEYTPSSGGTCAPCGGSDAAPFAVVVILAFLMLCIGYHLVARQPQGKGKAPLSVMLVVTTGGQLIILAQMTGVLSSFSVEWDEPFGTLLSIAKVMTSFNLDILRLSCVATLSPLSVYISRVSIIFLGMTSLAVIYIVHTLVLAHGRFGEMGKKLLVALGALSMALFISVVSTITAPLQCVRHPSGDWTVRSFPVVLCSNADGSDWIAMMVIALLVSIFPLTLLALVCWVVRIFPSRMQRVDTNFFSITGFLFVCYRVETYWFCLVVWFRNLSVSLVPIVPDMMGQIVLFNIVVLSMLVMVSKFSPWRALIANYLDMAIYYCVIGVNSLALGFASPDTSILATLCLVFIVLALVCIAIAGCYGLAKVLMPLGKKYEFFLSHHKAAAGAFARLLKMMILEVRQNSCEVFIDADNLTSLDLLFDTVGSQVENMVVITSSEILKRPWCVGEITIANIKKVYTYPMYCSDYVKPEVEFIDNYISNVPDIKALTENNIAINSIQDALRWFNTLPFISLPEKLGAATLDRLVANILECKIASLDESMKSVKEAKSRKDAEVMIAADENELEAMATARVLCKLLISHGRGEAVGQNSTSKLPEILADTTDDGKPAKLTDTTTMVVIVLTGGCFKTSNLIRTIHQASEFKAALMPVLAGDTFRFPTTEFYDELHAIAVNILGSQTAADKVIAGVFSMFKRIAPLFESNGSQAILKAQSAEVYKKVIGFYQSGRSASADWDVSKARSSMSPKSASASPQVSTLLPSIDEVDKKDKFAPFGEVLFA